MKVLWLCNIVLPDFSQEFGIKRNVAGGWMTGMLHELEKMKGIEVSLCFPIYDPVRLKEGECRGHRYYTFLCSSRDAYTSKMTELFEIILEKSKPDIVHIWGTEYPHTTSMVKACKNYGILEKTVINIQGLISVCAQHYLADIPEKYRCLRPKSGNSINEDRDLFEKRGQYEIESLKTVKHVIGRTDWDRACVEAINPDVQYYDCDEILKSIFYEYMGKWRYEKCQKYSIFVSQASYPIKGFHYLLQALPVIINRYPDTHVYVAGQNIFEEKKSNSYIFYVNDLMEKLNLYEHISFLGKLCEKEMVKQYLRANVFVLPSSIENSPNSLNEAMIIGSPSVVSYVGGICNRVETGIDVFLYPHNEPALLAHYVCVFFENKDNICKKFSLKGTKKIKEKINPKMNVEKNVKIYKNILAHYQEQG